MNKKLEKLKKYRAEVRMYEDTIRYYRKLYAADGEIDELEQERLNRLNNNLQKITCSIEKHITKLSPKQKEKNRQSRTQESLTDKVSSTDDFIHSSLIYKHIIQEGESLYGIAKKYKTTIEKLMEWNNLKTPSMSQNGYFPDDKIIISDNYPKNNISYTWDDGASGDKVNLEKKETLSIKHKQSVEFIPYKITVQNNGKEIVSIGMDPTEGHPQKFSFKIDSGVDFEQLADNIIIITVEGMDVEVKTLERKSFKTEPIHLESVKKINKIIIHFDLYWYGDGKKEFPIMINGLATEEAAGKAYWDGAPKVSKVIQEETGSTFSEEDALFLDGDKGGDGFSNNMAAHYRYNEGIKEAKKQASDLFAKLKKNNKNKIIQQIQVYTHSRGSVYALGFLDQLKREIKKKSFLFEDPESAIDLVVHMDAHQSGAMDIDDNTYPTIFVSHKGSFLGQSSAKGDAFNIENKHGNIGEVFDHKIDKFGSELDQISDNHNKNEINQEKNKYLGFDNLFKDAKKAKHAGYTEESLKKEGYTEEEINEMKNKNKK